MALIVGDKIGLVSTARKISKTELAPAIEQIEKWGLIPVFSSTLFEEDHQLAGSDDQRIEGIQSFIDDDSIKAILCVRGGYGSVRIVDQINYSALRKSQKPIIGYSDVTVFHFHLWSNKIAPTIHATMPINFEKNTPEALESLRRVLFDEKMSYQVSSHNFNVHGKAEGILVGGNLSILYSLLGTKSLGDFSEVILFIEDLDEYLYHIDRMMMNISRNGILSKIKGMVVGGLTDMYDNAIPFGESAEEIVYRHTKGLKIPVAFGFPSGHLVDNRALKMGVNVTLSVSETTELSWS